jgi:transcription elongation factor Elf1
MVKPTEPKRPKGITCPTCVVKVYTRRVILLANGTVRRVRRCKQCGYKCSTTERPAPSQN